MVLKMLIERELQVVVFWRWLFSIGRIINGDIDVNRNNNVRAVKHNYQEAQVYKFLHDLSESHIVNRAELFSNGSLLVSHIDLLE